MGRRPLLQDLRFDPPHGRRSNAGVPLSGAAPSPTERGASAQCTRSWQRCVAFAKNVEKEIDDARKKILSALAALTRPLADPLTVGGTALVLFSLSVMTREAVFDAWDRREQAAAAAKAERDAQTAHIQKMIDTLNDRAVIPLGAREEAFVHATGRELMSRLFLVLEDMEPGQVQTVLNDLQQRGIPVRGLVNTCTSMGDYPPLTDSLTGKDLTVEHVAWAAWQWDQLPANAGHAIRWNDITRSTAQKTADIVRRYGMQHWADRVPDITLVLRGEGRTSAQGRSFVDELFVQDPTCCVAYINRSYPVHRVDPTMLQAQAEH